MWVLTLGLCGLSALLALGATRLIERAPLTPRKPAPDPSSKPEPIKPAFQIPQAWIQQLTPVADPQKVRTRLTGTLLLEVLYKEGEALWAMTPELWETAKKVPDAQSSPDKGSSAALRWPGALGGWFAEQKKALEITETPMELLPPPKEECLVRWWFQGEPRAEADGCDLDGGFELEVQEVPGSQGWLELSYPGRLAGLIPVTVGNGGALDLGKVALGYGFSAGLKVTDPEGRALSGVRTRLRHYGMPEEMPPFFGRTNAQGEMRWSGLPAGAATVELRHPGFRTQTVQIGAPREELVPAELEPVERLWGQVYLPAAIRDDGQSDQDKFAKVKVRLAGSGIWPPKVEACRDDGGFQFSQIPVGVYAIEAYIDEDELQLASYPLENVPSDHAVSLSLLPAFALVIELLDEEGDPVVGAKVSARSNALGLLARECVSDEVGACRLPALVPSRYSISVHADGFLPREQTLDRSLALDAPAHEVLTWALEPAPSCVARILDPEGQPLGMAQVWVQRDTGQDNPLKKSKEVVAVGVSDAAGYVGFDPLAPGRYRLGARLEGWTAGRGVSFTPGAACEQLQMTMQPAVKVVGQVFDDQGVAVADAAVQLRNPKGQILAQSRSDQDGNFALEDARGKVQLVVKGTGYRPYTQSMKLRSRDGEAMEVMVTLAVMPTGHLELALVDQEGRGRPDLQVEFVDPKGLRDKIFAVADRHGVVEIERLPAGTWQVRAWCQGQVCLRRSLKWKANEGVVQKKWEIADPWQLVLTVLDDVSEPVVGAGLRLGEHRTLSDERGEAVFESLWESRVSLRVRADSFVTQSIKIKRPKEEAQLSQTVILQRAGGIEGEILDPWGTPLVEASVVLRWKGGQVSVKSGPEGHFSLRGVPQGDWELEVQPPLSRPDLPARQVPVNIRPQMTTRDVFVTLGEL